jgi:c-di-GMP-binding flagellar brake protein YcgR
MLPLRKNEIVVGKPLPWPVYNSAKKLLLCEGFVVESPIQVERLLAVGLFRPTIEGGGGRGVAAAEGSASPEELAEILRIPSNIKTFESAGMGPGLPLQLSPLSFPDDRYIVKLVGYLPGESILVSHPTKDGKIIFIKEGLEYRCRAFNKRNAYAFECSVLKSQLLPFPYLHLSYPAGVKTEKVRASSRISTDIPASVFIGSSRYALTGMIRDLSLNGALVQSSTQLGEKGDTVRVAFRLKIDDAPTLFEFDTVIRNATTDPDDALRGLYRTGIEFPLLQTDLRRMLELYVYRELAKES